MDKLNLDAIKARLDELEIQIDKLYELIYNLSVGNRRAWLMVVDNTEREFDINPRTAELREQAKLKEGRRGT